MNMKKKILFCGLLALFFAWACEEDDNLQPSGIERDWLAIEDDPNDPLTHLRYEIYTNYGVSVYFNDTLGSETRYDRYGNPYTHYETLKIGYNLVTNNKPYYVLSDDEEDMMAALEAMNKYLFPILPEDQRPVSYLLVDSLKLGSNTAQPYVEEYYKFLRTTCIGSVDYFKELSDSAQRSRMAEIAGAELVEELVADLDSVTQVEFDSIGMGFRLTGNTQPLLFNSYGGSSYVSTSRALTPPEVFGLLHYRGRTLQQVYYPTKEQNYAAFMGLVLSETDEVVYERYAQDTCVLQKYDMMKTMMQNAGLIEGGGEEDPAEGTE